MKPPIFRLDRARYYRALDEYIHEINALEKENFHRTCMEANGAHWKKEFEGRQ